MIGPDARNKHERSMTTGSGACPSASVRCVAQCQYLLVVCGVVKVLAKADLLLVTNSAELA